LIISSNLPNQIAHFIMLQRNIQRIRANYHFAKDAKNGL
jgi:hypothetical protein